jgi:hypothetical protein
LVQTKRQEPAHLGSDKGGWYSHTLASALPPSARGDFLQIVADKIAALRSLFENYYNQTSGQ